MQTTTAAPVLPPPGERNSILSWLHRNLFSTWYNSLLSLGSIGVIFLALRGFLNWAFTTAEWQVVITNLRLFLVGQYPVTETWRIWVCLYLLSVIIGASWGIWVKNRSWIGPALVLTPWALALLPFSTTNRLYLVGLPIIGILGWLVSRGRQKTLGQPLVYAWAVYFVAIILIIRGLTPEGGLLPVVGTNLWGGLLLTFLLTVVGIIFSFPIGILLALGRQGNLPVVRWFSVAFIEVVRGVPLVAILFMAQLMLPLFLPGNMTVDRVLRAMVGITLFSAAYLAENVRGGLQAIPKGQYEAAYALGLNGFQTMSIIILPQALRIVIPILVGQFIALFKDTTLVAIVGLFDLLGIARTVLAQPDFIGRQMEVYIFITLIFFVFSYVMSYVSQRLETALGVGDR